MRPLLALSVCLMTAAAAAAVERMALPPIDLTASDGQSVRADQLARDGHWIMFVVRPDCRTCDAILESIDASARAEAPSRVAVIVQSDRPAALAEAISRFPNLAGAQWLLDTTGALAQRVAPNAAATVLGIQGATIEWSVVGIFTNAADVKPVVTSWLDR